MSRPSTRAKKRKKTLVNPNADQMTHKDWLKRKRTARQSIDRHRKTDAFIPSNM